MIFCHCFSMAYISPFFYISHNLAASYGSCGSYEFSWDDPVRNNNFQYHHRSSSRLSSCRLLDCTTWAPRPPLPPAPPLAAAATAASAAPAGVKVDGGSPAGMGRPEGGEEGGAGRAGYRPAEGPRARTRGWQRRQLATLGRGRGPPNHLRRPRGGGARPLRLYGGEGGKRLLQFGKRGFFMMSNLHRTATQYSRKRILFKKEQAFAFRLGS